MSTHWRKLTNPNYLGSWDVEPGKDLTIKILSVSQEIVEGVGGEKEECPVARIENHKPFVLNKTNCKSLEKIFGSPYVEDWKNKKVTVYVEKVKAFGSVTDALRVRNVPVDQREELTPKSPRWQGAIQALKDGKCDIEYIQKNFKISQSDTKKLEEESNA